MLNYCSTGPQMSNKHYSRSWGQSICKLSEIVHSRKIVQECHVGKFVSCEQSHFELSCISWERERPLCEWLRIPDLTIILRFGFAIQVFKMDILVLPIVSTHAYSEVLPSLPEPMLLCETKCKQSIVGLISHKDFEKVINKIQGFVERILGRYFPSPYCSQGLCQFF